MSRDFEENDPLRAQGGHRPKGPGSGESDGGVAIQEGEGKLAEPPRYAVILHNDDYTTMEFVIEVLQRYFRKTGDEAAEIMLRVHNEGRGAAGVYSFEIAETKVAQVERYARERGYPLKCSVEEA